MPFWIAPVCVLLAILFAIMWLNLKVADGERRLTPEQRSELDDRVDHDMQTW